MNPGFQTRSDEWGVVMRETTRSTGFGMGAFSSFVLLGWRSSLGDGALLGGARDSIPLSLLSIIFNDYEHGVGWMNGMGLVWVCLRSRARTFLQKARPSLGWVASLLL